MQLNWFTLKKLVNKKINFMENNYFDLQKKIFDRHGELFWFTMQILVYKKKMVYKKSFSVTKFFFNYKYFFYIQIIILISGENYMPLIIE